MNQQQNHQGHRATVLATFSFSKANYHFFKNVISTKIKCKLSSERWITISSSSSTVVRHRQKQDQTNLPSILQTHRNQFHNSPVTAAHRRLLTAEQSPQSNGTAGSSLIAPLTLQLLSPIACLQSLPQLSSRRLVLLLPSVRLFTWILVYLRVCVCVPVFRRCMWRSRSRSRSSEVVVYQSMLALLHSHTVSLVTTPLPTAIPKHTFQHRWQQLLSVCCGPKVSPKVDHRFQKTKTNLCLIILSCFLCVQPAHHPVSVIK